MCQSFPVKKIRGEREKIAVKRANLQTARIAAFSLLLLFITSISSANTAWAESSGAVGGSQQGSLFGNRAQGSPGSIRAQNWIPANRGSLAGTRVTSILEGRDKTSIELTTEKNSVVPRPIIKFLPQDNGDTVMMADFVGLSWQHPTRVFSTGTGFGAHEKGIKVIRVGSFQERPPICRISITARDKNLLSAVSFGAGPGRLTVSWPGSVSGRQCGPRRPTLPWGTAHP
jgi:hypothetical protein